jgi:glycosyltransferase involved in cell wall biosynthesis
LVAIEASAFEVLLEESMKIIQVFNQYLNAGGEENSVNRIARHLEVGGHEVKRFWRSSNEWTSRNAPPKWMQASLIGNNQVVLGELKELHETFCPDVWILHNVLPVISVGIYSLATKLDVPIVQWLHNYRPISVSGVNPSASYKINYLKECLSGEWRGSRLQTSILAFHYLKAIYNKDFDSVKAWVTVSDMMHEEFAKRSWFPEKISTLHHSWDIRSVLPRKEEDSYFLFLGRIIEEKGIRFLVTLFGLPSMRSHQLYVAGRGELEQELRLTSSSNVKWLGFVTGEEKRQVIRDSLAVVFPSLWKEPLSTVAYEAYEQKRCVISSDQGGMPEIVFNGSTGLVLPAGDLPAWTHGIQEISKNELEAYGRNGRSWLVENVSPEEWNNQFRKIVQDRL